MKKSKQKTNAIDLILKYLLAAALIMVPLYPKFPFISVPGTFVSIRLEDFLVGLAGAVWLIAIISNIGELLSNKVNTAILLFLGVTLLSTFVAIFLNETAGKTIATLHWVRRVEYLVPFFTGSYLVSRHKEYIGFYLKLTVIVVIVTFIYGFGQKYFSWPVIITQNMEYSKGVALRWIPGSHINSTFAGHYDLATFLVLVLPILASMLFVLRGKWTTIFLSVTFFSGLWLMVAAISRISIASYLMSASFALLFVKKYKAIPVVLVISIVVFSSSGDLQTRYSRIFSVVRNKLSSYSIDAYAQGATALPDPKIEGQEASPQPEDRSSSIRFNVEWPRAIRAFKKNPLLGTGYSSITLATDNDYLRLLGEVGILGFLTFGMIFMRIIELSLKSFPLAKKFSGIELAFVAGVLGAVPGLLLNAVFIDIFEASKFAILFWLMMGFTIGLLGNEKVTKTRK